MDMQKEMTERKLLGIKVFHVQKTMAIW